jgi:hypothetical protein
VVHIRNLCRFQGTFSEGWQRCWSPRVQRLGGCEKIWEDDEIPGRETLTHREKKNQNLAERFIPFPNASKENPSGLQLFGPWSLGPPDPPLVEEVRKRCTSGSPEATGFSHRWTELVEVLVAVSPKLTPIFECLCTMRFSRLPQTWGGC